MAGQTALGTEWNAAEAATSDPEMNQEALLMSQINAAAAELHRFWSERAAGLRDDDPAWSAQIRALNAKIASAYEAHREDASPPIPPVRCRAPGPLPAAAGGEDHLGSITYGGFSINDPSSRNRDLALLGYDRGPVSGEDSHSRLHW